MKRMDASKFKQKCLSILDRLPPDGILITKHGKPVATVLPSNGECAGLIGSLKGKIKIRGDAFSTGLKWNAEP
jgi:hypothetical protein